MAVKRKARFVANPKAFLFQNSDPIGSLKANVATAVVKQLSNLRLEVLLENRDALSRKVREEVSPTSSQWGFNLGSTYIRKVAFRGSRTRRCRAGRDGAWRYTGGADRRFF